MFYYTKHHFVAMHEAHASDQNKHFELKTSIFKEKDLQCDLIYVIENQKKTPLLCTVNNSFVF